MELLEGRLSWGPSLVLCASAFTGNCLSFLFLRHRVRFYCSAAFASSRSASTQHTRSSTASACFYGGLCGDVSSFVICARDVGLLTLGVHAVRAAFNADARFFVKFAPHTMMPDPRLIAPGADVEALVHAEDVLHCSSREVSHLACPALPVADLSSE